MPSSCGQVGKAVIGLTKQGERIFRRNRGHGPQRRPRRAEDISPSHFPPTASASATGSIGSKVQEIKTQIKEADWPVSSSLLSPEIHRLTTVDFPKPVGDTAFTVTCGHFPPTSATLSDLPVAVTTGILIQQTCKGQEPTRQQEWLCGFSGQEHVRQPQGPWSPHFLLVKAIEFQKWSIFLLTKKVQ